MALVVSSLEPEDNNASSEASSVHSVTGTVVELFSELAVSIRTLTDNFPTVEGVEPVDGTANRVDTALPLSRTVTSLLFL